MVHMKRIRVVPMQTKLWLLLVVFVLLAHTATAEIFLSAVKPEDRNGSIASIVEPEDLELLEKLALIYELSQDDPAVKAEARKYVLARYSYEVEKLAERQRVIYWTNRAGIVIFVMTHCLILLGFWAALREFLDARKTRRRSVETQELELSLERIALKTSLHGSVIFAFTLLLYLLFLKFVYPVTVVSSP